MMMNNDFNRLASEVGILLAKHNSMLVTAESCTGGWVAEAITAIPGSSKWFERGYVTYSNSSKQELLNVTEQTIAVYGAVSEQTAIEMADGALKNSHAQIALAVTGIAGPDGGEQYKPVGTVYFAWVGERFACQVAKMYFSGDRQTIRQQAVAFSLESLIFIMRIL